MGGHRDNMELRDRTIPEEYIKKNIFQKQSNMRTSKSYHTPDMWTSLVEDFRAKTSALRETVWVSPEAARDYGVRCIEL